MNDRVSKFVWQDAYSVGDSVLDEQHRRIIDILNLLYDLLHSEATGEDFTSGLKQVFAELHTYILMHFEYEEERMAATGYPAAQLVAHKRAHARLIERVTDFETTIAGSSPNAIAAIMPFIYGDWLIEHICGTDHQYAPFLHGLDVSAAPD